MSSVDHDILVLQDCVSNRIDSAAIGAKKIAGVIGDVPSHYSKSPALWNAVFDALQMDAIYVPFDIRESQIPKLVRLIKDSPRFLGANVTVPYKIKIIPHLDAVEEKTRRLDAVNTIVRSPEGKLIGSNTDGKGFLTSLLSRLPGQDGPFLDRLDGIDVLMIGAGGAARALAFSLAEILGSGSLVICNRSLEPASSLARDIKEIFANVSAINENQIGLWAPRVGLIVNASVKGQEGLRKVGNEKITFLEPYSALAPANPPAFPEAESRSPEFYRKWLKAALPDIETNNRTSLKLALEVPPHVAFCDLIYAPAESVFLRHARFGGHRTLNGKGMIIVQAAEALFHAIARPLFERNRTYTMETYQQVLHLMFNTW